MFLLKLGVVSLWLLPGYLVTVPSFPAILNVLDKGYLHPDIPNSPWGLLAVECCGGSSWVVCP